MNDNEIIGGAFLVHKDYERIESLVVDLYEELGVKAFPIKPFDIARQKGYKLVPYSQMNRELQTLLRSKKMFGASGRTLKGAYKIFYDDSNCEARQRFTVMHEIGHIHLQHKEDSMYAEKCANYFASYALAPSPMINRYGCGDYLDVALRFNISEESAIYAFDRGMRWASLHYNLKPYKLKSYEIKIDKLIKQ